MYLDFRNCYIRLIETETKMGKGDHSRFVKEASNMKGVLNSLYYLQFFVGCLTMY